MIRLVAFPDGFLGRKSDGGPGAKTIAIGIQRTMDAALPFKHCGKNHDFCVTEMRESPIHRGVGKAMSADKAATVHPAMSLPVDIYFLICFCLSL